MPAFRSIYLILIFSMVCVYMFYMYVTSNLTTLEKSRAVDVTTNIESTLTSIAHDELTLNIDNKIRKENVIIITKDDYVVIDAIQNRFMEYVKTQPNLVFKKSDIKVKLKKGSYRTSGNKLVQFSNDYPRVEIEATGAFRNGAGIKNYNSSDDLIPIAAYTTVELEQLTVNKNQDNRDDKTIKGYDFEDYGKKYDNGTNFNINRVH